MYRLLEKKLDSQFTCHTIVTTLQDMKLFYISEKPAYMTAYKRINVTDALHDTFGYRTDYKAMFIKTVRHLKKRNFQTRKHSIICGLKASDISFFRVKH